MPKNIGDNRIDTADIARISEADAVRLQKYRVRTGDIVYSRRGDVERRALIRHEEDGWLCGTGCLRVRFGGSSISPEYASFYLGHPNVSRWVVRHAHGATMPNLNTSILSQLPFIVPPLPEQQAIAHVLGTLDDKIELNRKMNTTLDEIARTLFTSWFVDFDPVRAKAEGRQPEGMDAETAALFPDRFVDSEFGPIPEGWRWSTIGQETRVVGGGTPSTKKAEYWAGGQFNWATPKDLAGLSSLVLMETSRQITEVGLGQISSGLLPPRTVLLSSRAPVGYVAIAGRPTAVNQGFIAMICEGQLSTSYVVNWTRENLGAIKARANGSTFLEVSKASFRPLPVLVPSVAVLDAFNSVTNDLYALIAANVTGARILGESRDVLLPELVSGRMQVPVVEEAV